MPRQAKQISPEMLVHAREHVAHGGSRSSLARAWGIGMPMMQRLIKRTPELAQIFADAGTDPVEIDNIPRPREKPNPPKQPKYRPSSEPQGPRRVRMPLLIDRRNDETPKSNPGTDDTQHWPFVMGLLPEELYPAYTTLQALHGEKRNVYKTVQALPDHHRQHIWFYVYIQAKFNPNNALLVLAMRKEDFDEWLLEYPDFNRAWRNVYWHKKNHYESCLVRACDSGDGGAIVFANKTINHGRGYKEPAKLVEKPVEVLDAKTDAVDLAELDLPINVRVELMNAMESARIGKKKNDESRGTVEPGPGIPVGTQ